MTSPATLSPVFDLESWSVQIMQEVEEALHRWIPENAPANLSEPMRYAVLGGGKRLRALLTLGSFEACLSAPRPRNQPISFDHSKRRQAALRSACAIEIIHAYSLVHDDMPCMDNDVLRRGKPTVHVKYGEAVALLTGDTLQALAFEVLLGEQDQINAHLAVSLLSLIVRAAGYNGMAGGQAIDLRSVGLSLSEEDLSTMHRLKTGALLEASVIAGALCAGASENAIGYLRQFAKAIGLAFQVIDDILDVTADSKALGKTAGKDAANDKPTYVSLLGLEGARLKANDLHLEALSALESCGLPYSDVLRAIAAKVVTRTS
jgi:farnesyl diphosphate synthase